MASGLHRAITDGMPTPAAAQCRRKFLRYFPHGFADETYLDWERSYKAAASRAWALALSPTQFSRMLKTGQFREIAAEAIRIESRTNLLFSFEKMALRDATRSPAGARQFAEGLFDFRHGTGTLADRFTGWTAVVARGGAESTASNSQGKRTRNDVPRWRPALSATMEPPCRSMIWRATASPIPKLPR